MEIQASVGRNWRSRAELWAPVLTIAAILASCGPKAGAPAPQADGVAVEAGKAYHRSPEVGAVRLEAGRPVMSGRAAADAEVRLAAPGGEPSLAKASTAGEWSLEMPPLTAPAIFGLSAESDGRRLQGEGYVLLTPQGEGALLRSGSGAMRLDALAPGQIGAIDLDGGGQAVVSGAAPAGLTVTIYLDRKRTAEGRADAAGRFSIALPQALSAGPHRVEATGMRFGSAVAFQRATAAALTDGPMRAAPAAAGLQVDWLTPGGGVQTTLIVRPSTAAETPQ
jgi:hypothetical protein